MVIFQIATCRLFLKTSCTQVQGASTWVQSNISRRKSRICTAWRQRAALLNMNNQTFAVIPHSGGMASHLNQILFPGTINQTPEMTHFSGQPLGTVFPRIQLHEGTRLAGNIYTGRRGEPKAIQILIGLIHVGFGSILPHLLEVHKSFTVLSGYVYWGGLFFIVSGSVLVVTEQNKSLCLVKISTGMNIISTVAATVGIIVLIMDEDVSSDYYNASSSYLKQRSAQGLLNVLLIFAILEFFIGITSSSFGCEAIFQQSDEATHDAPDGVMTHTGALLPIDPPPSYEAHTNLSYDTSQLE
ncbi:membrane-spanning 4-domains subfamily A member 15-like isoform X2 [Rhineura floridana]|uniref:membrane-spanning 4-domains subfamily A member 15-like isoform X2 n=1 Tax=Rhineura floridana TaxID=261503 RepID=UPI002AC87DEC|nr:membrane-spanning 4-domains subfamily A member 15-like isoform X2 [Rhineura floridana]